MEEQEKLRLGGMALGNGVLVHGPHAWACAVRTKDGELRVVARRKRFQAASVSSPLLRGPARILEVFALLPQVKRELPAARLPMEHRRVVWAMVGTTVAVQLLKRARVRPAVREAASGLLSLAPAVLGLRGGELAAYHGAEHISIGTYEHGEHRPKEHERCGSHLVGPLLLTSAAGRLVAERAPEAARPVARAVAAFGALAVSVETFSWMARNPEHPVARALAFPGHELQHRLGTKEPTAAQLEVADAALHACLELETS